MVVAFGLFGWILCSVFQNEQGRRPRLGRIFRDGINFAAQSGMQNDASPLDLVVNTFLKCTEHVRFSQKEKIGCFLSRQIRFGEPITTGRPKANSFGKGALSIHVVENNLVRIHVFRISKCVQCRAPYPYSNRRRLSFSGVVNVNGSTNQSSGHQRCQMKRRGESSCPSTNNGHSQPFPQRVVPIPTTTTTTTTDNREISVLTLVSIFTVNTREAKKGGARGGVSRSRPASSRNYASQRKTLHFLLTMQNKSDGRYLYSW
mmetsp:Transcript_2501/g.5468  ORF Transcript_2501/g.5468 Transcript_2501/m.5468 type:complete len:260 (+) Transcript_2501:1410-2189(+)